MGPLCLSRGVSQITLGPQEVMVEAQQGPLGPRAVQEGSLLSGGPLRIVTCIGVMMKLVLKVGKHNQELEARIN